MKTEQEIIADLKYELNRCNTDLQATQMVIDLVQDMQTDIFNHDYTDEPKLFKSLLGSCHYRVTLILEVIDSKFEYDIELLRKLERLLNHWQLALNYKQ